MIRTIKPAEQANWDAAVPLHWRVEDGELVNDGKEPHLVTDRDFGDFELWVDWKLSPKGDSGIYLRGCPQVQLWDPTNVKAHQHGSDKGSGTLWNNEKHERWPTEVADKPIGQWNNMYVHMVGEYVTVVLNGKKVADNVLLENYYDRKTPVPAQRSDPSANARQRDRGSTTFSSARFRLPRPTSYWRRWATAKRDSNQCTTARISRGGSAPRTSTRSSTARFAARPDTAAIC